MDIAYKKTQSSRMDMKTGINLLLCAGNKPQLQIKTLARSKGLGKYFPTKQI